MAQFGSRTSSVSQNLSAVQDPQGNLIVSPDNSFGASPLGVAARTQALYGIPNANFNLLPPDDTAEIATGNELPYWNIVNLGGITAKMNYDETAQAWDVRIDPSAAGSGDSLTLTTRSYLLNDSNLSLRQKAFAAITKIGTMATSEWDLVLSAVYYDSAGSALSTYAIGTANSGTTWTSINGFTTTGTAIIDAAAQYVDLSLALTTTAAVTGTAKVDIGSLLLQTSTTGGGGAQSFLITEAFSASGTFVWPTGVDYLLAVVAVGAGSGAQGGGCYFASAAGTSTTGTQGQVVAGNAVGYGAEGGRWVLARDIPRGTATSLVIGVGAGGAGGTAVTFTKAAGSTTAGGTTNPAGTSTEQFAGGSTTIGSYYTLPGYNTTITGTTFNDSKNAFGTALPYIPYWPDKGTCANAGTASYSFTGTAAHTAIVSTSAIGTGQVGWGFDGVKFAASGTAQRAGTVNSATAGTAAQPGASNAGGGAGATIMMCDVGTVATTGNTITLTGGNGANGGHYGASGGAGGHAGLTIMGTAYRNASGITLTSGAGGSGADGYVVLVYVA